MTAPGNPAVSMRALTRGPKYHWFGYYDKLQFDPTGRYVLGMEVDFEGRSPTPEDEIRLGMIDLAENDRWIELGQTRAWCWQQGCMLQWIPGAESEVIYNDRTDDGFCARVLDVFTGETRTLEHPVYALSPDGGRAVSLDFLRTGRLRPGYGYAGEDPTRDVDAPDDHGLYAVNLASGRAEMIFTIAQAAAQAPQPADADDCVHWFNHLLFNPDGSRFLFLHRWHPRDKGGIHATRMCTADPDGGNVRVLHPGGKFSHFIWRDPDHILAWAERAEAGRAFYLIHEKTGAAEVVGADKMTADGHCTYLPGGEWILNDSYPQGASGRDQPLYLYHPATDRRIDLGPLHSPPAYTGEWRCDLHPRTSRDGRCITIDSTHAGNGRQIYLLDIQSVVE